MAENAKSAVGGPVFAGNPDGRNGQLHSARDAAGKGRKGYAKEEKTDEAGVTTRKDRKWTPQELAEKRREQLKEITDRLESGLKEYMATDVQFRKVLETMAKFHHYSANNVLLIAMQMPTATHVASYTNWQKKFKRQVMKGQRGLSIIMPAPYKKKVEQEARDPATGRALLHLDGSPVMEEVEVTVPRYKVAKVFDLSQTVGAPLPELDVPELTGTVENYGIFMDAMRAVSPVPIRFGEIEGGAKGYYDNANKEIVIRNGMSELQTMKTAVHEVSHARLHDRDVMRADGTVKDQHTREIEAESIAHVVLAHYQLGDSSEYSIPYLASWCESMDTMALRTSLDTIRKAASAIIDDVDAYVAERDLDRYTIYQIEEGTPADGYYFMDLDFAKEQGIPVTMEYYQDVYRGYLAPEDTLEALYEKFNRDDRPAADKMHSMSMSDVVVLHKNGEDKAYYVDAVGFSEVPEFFLSAQEQNISYGQEAPQEKETAQEQEVSGQEQETSKEQKTSQEHDSEKDIPAREGTAQAEKDTVPAVPEEMENVAGGMLTFYAAECMDIPVLGEYRGGLTLGEAFQAYQEIPSDDLHGGKGVGFTLRDGSDYAGDHPLLASGHVQEEAINAVEHYLGIPALQEAVHEAKEFSREEALRHNIQEKSPEHVPAQPPESSHETTPDPAGTNADTRANAASLREAAARGDAGMKREAGGRKESVLAALRKHRKDIETGTERKADRPRTAQRQKGGPEL